MFRIAILLSLAPAAFAADTDAKLYELRVYTAEKGKLDDLHARFRDHTVKLFEKHGMTNIGYWVPLDNKENKLYYLLSHADRATRDASFKTFAADVAWQTAAKESEKNGKIVAGIEHHFLTMTDYSPKVAVVKSPEERVFELRLYTATKGNLPALNDRFRNNTVKLFEKHGIGNLWYANAAAGEKTADTSLIYMLTHKSQEAGKKAFDAFRADPDWIAAKKASEDKAGGSLTTADGVKSIYLKATDYSPMK